MSSFNKLSLSQSHGTEASRLLAASPNSDTEGMTFSLFDALYQAQSIFFRLVTHLKGMALSNLTCIFSEQIQYMKKQL